MAKPKKTGATPRAPISDEEVTDGRTAAAKPQKRAPKKVTSSKKAVAPQKRRWPKRLLIATLLLLVSSPWSVPFVLTRWPTNGTWQAVSEIKSKLEGYGLAERIEYYDAKGRKIAGSGTRRKILKGPEIPELAIKAFVAAEDAKFWQHDGIDRRGMLRCAWLSAWARKIVCGGSTMTQQIAKRVFLSSGKTAERKVGDIVIALRMEKAVNKQTIMELYVNEIYLGHGAYGFAAAAEEYFGKAPRELTLAEIALIAGLPPAPARYDPFKNETAARNRRAYVLGRMLKEGFIDATAHAAATQEPLKLRDREVTLKESYYVAYAERLLKGILTEEQLALGGLRVFLGMDADLQSRSEEAARDGLREYDKRHGWRGAPVRLDLSAPGSTQHVIQMFENWMYEQVKRARIPEGQTPIWDFREVATMKPGTPVTYPDLQRLMRIRPLTTDAIVGGLVTEVTKSSAVIALGEAVATVHYRGSRWTKKSDMSEVVKVGDFVLVRVTEGRARRADGKVDVIGLLEQEPMAQTAVVVMDPVTREVRALVGGYGSGAGTFNRATDGVGQQPGSAFKPFIYLSALSTGRYSPVSKCLDSPFVYYDEGARRPWKPENYHGGFDGEMTLRTALAKSKNTCSVKLIYEITPQQVIAVAQAAGIKSKLSPYLTLALGANEVTPLELTNAYATIAANGVYAEPIFITQVTDLKGKVLYEAPRNREQRIAPNLAYLTTSLMESVVQEGTGQKAKALGCTAAGKTGTTNDSRDAWFAGFTATSTVNSAKQGLVSVVWVGHDDNSPLGEAETGGGAALPVWIKALKGTCDPTAKFMSPVPDPSVPGSGVEFTYVDSKSGGRVESTDPRAKLEVFLFARTPTVAAPELLPSGEVVADPTNFGMDDYR